MIIDNWICPFCGATNAADATHCKNCGIESPVFPTSAPNVAASVSAPVSAATAFTAHPAPSPIKQINEGDEELLITYARFIKIFAILLCILGVLGCIVSTAEDGAWLVAVIVPGVIFLSLPLFLIAAAIRVYCNISLNLHSINDNLQKIVQSKNL